MAELIQGIDNGSKSQLLAQVSLYDTFPPKVMAVFGFFSEKITMYLKDYYLLINDLRNQLNEESQKRYYDYGFIVEPVNKAFELYLQTLLTTIFGFDLSKNPIGHYLNLPEDKKETELARIQDRLKMSGVKITIKEWKQCWEALRREWDKNRNSSTHIDEEPISTLKIAEQITLSMMNEMRLSANLISKEILDPVAAFLKEQKEKQMPTVNLPQTEK